MEAIICGDSSLRLLIAPNMIGLRLSLPTIVQPMIVTMLSIKNLKGLNSCSLTEIMDLQKVTTLR